MKCCFCNAVIDGMGNSIHPIKRGRNARCCDECNVKVIIPLRLQTDTTAKQFLDALGYSTKSGSFVSRISEYNSLLVSNGLLKIKKYRDENGHERNIYSVLS